MVRRVVGAGGQHVVVTGVQLLGDTPWARARNQRDEINALSVAFNDALLSSIVDLGQNVLYFDAAFFFSLMYGKPQNFELVNGKDAVCTTPDASTCTAATVASADYNRWLFADGLHFSPGAQRKFSSNDYAESAYRRFKERW